MLLVTITELVFSQNSKLKIEKSFAIGRLAPGEFSYLIFQSN